MTYQGLAITGKPYSGSWLGFVMFTGGCVLIAGAIIVISVLLR